MLDASQLSLDGLRRIEQVCRQFESSHREDSTIEPWLEGFEGLERRALLEELVAVDIELLSAQGLASDNSRYSHLSRAEDRAVAQACLERSAEESARPVDSGRKSESGADEDSQRSGDTIGPTRIRQYSIVRPIGRGGMGQVFLAEQHEPVHRKVALKVINVDAPSKEVLARFDIERQALAMMDHNHIARVFDAGMTEDGLPFFAMELVVGDQITGFCETQQLSLSSRLKLFVQTCRAVQHAHQKGVMHRDLKPGNVLVASQDGEPIVKVIDFGLAKAVQPSIRLGDRTIQTRRGQIVGTLAYMSPEQAKLDELDIDARSDVYSLGVILYELLTGSTPVTKQRIESDMFDQVLKAIRAEEVTRPSVRLRELRKENRSQAQSWSTNNRLRIQLEEELDWILVKALEKDRSRRYDTAAALADDVERFLKGEPITARPPSAFYQLRKAFDRYTKLFVTAAALLTILILGLLGTATMWVRATFAEGDALDQSKLANAAMRRARHAETQQRQLAQEMQVQRDAAMTAKSSAIQEAARAKFQLARTRWEAGRIREARELLWQIPAEERHLEWRLVEEHLDESRLTLFGTKNVIDLRYIATGEKIIILSQDLSLKALDSRNFRQLESPKITNVIAISPDAKTCIRSGNEEFTIASVEDGNNSCVLAGQMQNLLSNFVFASKRHQVFAVSVAGDLCCWDTETGKLLDTFTLPPSSMNSNSQFLRLEIAISPLEDSIAVTWPGEVRVYELENWNEKLRLVENSRNDSEIAFSPDGRYLVYTLHQYMSRQLCAVDLSSNESVWRRDLPVMPWRGIEFHPAAHRLAICGEDELIYELDMASGETQRIYRGHESPLTTLRYSRDGLRLVSASKDGAIKLWDTRRQQPGEPIATRSGSVSYLQYSPDDRWLACLASATQVLLYDKSAMRLPQRLPIAGLGEDGFLNDINFSADSQSLAVLDSLGRITVFDVRSRTVSRTLSNPACRYTGLSYLANQLVAGDESGHITLWSQDFRSQELLRRPFEATPENPNAQEFHSPSPDSIRMVDCDPQKQYIASVDQAGHLNLWKADEMRLVASLDKNHDVESLEFSPDGRQLLFADAYGNIRIFDTSSGQINRSLSHGDWVAAACFSADGSRLISLDRWNALIVWDAITGDELLRLEIPKDARAVDCSPSDDQIVYGTIDSNFYQLSAPHTPRVIPLIGQSAQVVDFAFFDGGRKIMARSERETIAWAIPSGERVEPSLANTNPPREAEHPQWQFDHFGNSFRLLNKQRLLQYRDRGNFRSRVYEQLLASENEAFTHRRWFSHAFFAQQLKSFMQKELSESLQHRLEASRSKLTPQERTILDDLSHR